MNERILELAEQTLSKEREGEWPDLWLAGDKDLDKFAELIVRECAEISKNYAGGSLPLSIALAIKEHFGVK